MTDNNTFDDDYIPEISDKEIGDSLRQVEPAEGVYLIRSMGGVKKISALAKGKGLAMCEEKFALLRPSDRQPHSYTFKKWWILPIAPRASWLAANGYTGYEANAEGVFEVVPDSQIAKILANFDADGPNDKNLNTWRSRLRAGFGKEAYGDYPFQVKGSNPPVFQLADGSTVDKDGYLKAKGELIRAIKLTAHTVFGKEQGAFLKGQEFYCELEYQKNKEGVRTFDLPGFEWSYATPPRVSKTDNTPKEVLDPFVTVK